MKNIPQSIALKFIQKALVGRLPVLSFVVLLIASCSSPKPADLMIIGKKIYAPIPMDANAIIVRNDTIIDIGTKERLTKEYAAAQTLDHSDAFIYPGFIDAHCHFWGYGKGVFRADLVGTTSYAEVLDRLVVFDEKNNPDWLLGRGWDQNDWEIKEYPSLVALDSLFPDKPVIIKRVDGHAVLANSKALEMGGIDINSSVDGGEILSKDGKLTGILIDNAVDKLEDALPQANSDEIRKQLKAAEQDCFAVGLTTVDDAGLDKNVVELMGEMQDQGELKMRIYAMLKPSDENFKWMHFRGPVKSKYLNVRSFKIYADGALGSRGARLKDDYHDLDGHRGLWINDSAYFDSVARVIHELGMQMNTHCIGDEANELILNTYKDVIFDKEYMEGMLSSDFDKSQKASKIRNHRWRIEHAQVVDPDDIKLFGQYGIIPSVQATHATSDMYWAAERIGSNRMKGAYAYRSLLSSYGMIAMGSDFPVESINPLFGFYAAVTRQDQEAWPEDGFWKEEAITREEALMAMTIWAAHSNFEDEEKGSIDVGKLADFTILEKDIMEIDEMEIPKVKVLETIVGGESVYQLDEKP